MACVLYKDGEKILVDAEALNGLLSQGWKTEPDYPETPPTAAEFATFLNLHEELKRVNDAALSARDAHIKELTEQNEQLTEDLEVLEAENIQLRDTLVQALDELKEFKQAQPAVLVTTDEYERHEAETPPDYRSMKVVELREYAKKANIPNHELMRKPQLVKALENGSESAN